MMNLEDTITNLCIDKYNSLKKTGKPTEQEWTVLAGVVLENSFEKFSVISLCTGTKCLSGIELKNINYRHQGCRLRDSHAEVLARRAFLRYLYHQIDQCLSDDKSDIFYIENDKIKLKDVYFHFYSSQSPCGDCSIISKLKEDTDDCIIPNKKMKKENDNATEAEFGLEEIVINRTGAKCVENDERQDFYKDGVNDYKSVGSLRTKPGRGDRTLSLSCSDKMAKWNIMGVQGALLSLLIPCIKFKSIIIGGGCPYSLEAMQRGICTRFSSSITIPIIKQSQLPFVQQKSNSRTKPCPSSIIWCAVPERSVEIAVDGFKQGVTKKRKNICHLLISRREIFKTFLNVYERFYNKQTYPQHPKKLTYYHCKQFSKNYQNSWRDVQKESRTWPKKPLHLQECLTF